MVRVLGERGGSFDLGVEEDYGPSDAPVNDRYPELLERVRLIE